MTPEIVDIGFLELGFGLFFILIAGIASFFHALKLERDLLIGTVRTFSQLFLMGYILKIIFDIDNMLMVLSIFMFMIFFAARTIYGRIKEKQISFFFPTFFCSYRLHRAEYYTLYRLHKNSDAWHAGAYYRVGAFCTASQPACPIYHRYISFWN